MSLNGIMGIGISSVGVEDERREVARADGEAQRPVAGMRPDNLSAVQEDYVTLNSGAGQVVLARAAGEETLGQNETGERETGDRGSVFRAVA